MKKTLPDRLRRSVTRVNPKAKKPFKVLAKAHGVSKKTIKGALKRPGRAAAVSTAAAKAEPAPERGFSLREVLDRGQKLKKIVDQLRTTGGRTLRPKK